jgi:hypothetical protein
VDNLALLKSNLAKFDYASERRDFGWSMFAIAIFWTKGSSENACACTEAVRDNQYKDDHHGRGKQKVK